MTKKNFKYFFVPSLYRFESGILYYRPNVYDAFNLSSVDTNVSKLLSFDFVYYLKLHFASITIYIYTFLIHKRQSVSLLQ